MNVSKEQKLNAGSSTECELIGIADILKMMMWCKYFIEAQGYTIDNNILYQDNKSTILLTKNGRMSAGKNSKHIKNRFFLITDKVAQGDLKIEHMGTDDMWGDVNTKPTQGKRFRIMRAEVMGVSVDYDDDDERRRTHPLLMPNIESERISVTDGEILEKVAVVNPVKTPVKYPKEGETGGVGKRSIPPKARQAAKRRSVLEVDKYGPVESAKWKCVNARFPASTKLHM